MAGITHLIINSAYKEPQKHWEYDVVNQSFYLKDGRRDAGYIVASQEQSGSNQQGRFIPLPVVNEIRKRVKSWRENNYPGITGITRKLLEHWHNEDVRTYPFYFCQLDAMETLIWWTEAPATDRVGIKLQGDGSDFQRICTKMCTGSGKTTVMAMLIAWMVCNKVAYPQDKRFTKYVFVVTPGLTVKKRLASLMFGGSANEYVSFNIVPSSMMQYLRQGIIKIENWQYLSWETQEQIDKKKSVDKRPPKSDKAYARGVLQELSRYNNILVINDEAHHAWRVNTEVKIGLKGQDKKDYLENEAQATVWIGGLDRINRVNRILTCYDFTATPFAPSGKRNDEEALFGWIISDFGLNDGIESGLVKTPRVVVRDDGEQVIEGKTIKSKLYHLYRDEELQANLSRPAKPEEPLPDLLNQAYYLLGKDWQVTYEAWKKAGAKTPPVMITVANRTETAARIKAAFLRGDINVPELTDPKYLIQIDSKMLKSLETESGSKKDKEAELREIVDTVGKVGKPGQDIRKVISVGMLSEGWDARTVTHIMGLRAFSSQLLCEQVVGRGLRRTSYDRQEANPELFAPEYVNIFGIPFSFLPHEEDDDGKDIPDKPRTQISVIQERKNYEISWPNIVRFDTEYKQNLTIDYTDIPELVLNATDTRLSADLAPIVNGQTDITKLMTIDLEKLEAELRMQTVVFKAAGNVFDQLKDEWAKSGTRGGLLGKLVKLTEAFLQSDKIRIEPELFMVDGLRKRILLMMNMTKIIQHLCKYITDSWTEKIVPVYDPLKPVMSTGDMITWFTTKACLTTIKSHISHVACDSQMEATEATILELNTHVTAYAKNDHLDFKIPYLFNGALLNYIPDFLIRLDNGHLLVLETKGKMRPKDVAKREALTKWVEVVNSTKEFGIWHNDISFNTADVDGIIEKYCSKKKTKRPSQVAVMGELFTETDDSKYKSMAIFGELFDESSGIKNRKVVHSKFGPGVVEGVDEHNNIAIRFEDGKVRLFEESAISKGFIKLEE